MAGNRLAGYADRGEAVGYRYVRISSVRFSTIRVGTVRGANG
jgi:hypothetical protein